MRSVMRSVPVLLLGVALIGCGATGDNGTNGSSTDMSASQVVLKVPGMS